MNMIESLSFQSAPLALEIDGELTPGDVLAYRGSEGLSRLYRFEIELESEAPITLETLLGRPGRLSIRLRRGMRFFHGIIGRAEIISEFEGQTRYRVELFPQVWRLTQRTDMRIFQNKSTPEIFEAVMQEAGIPADAFDLSLLQGVYAKREYCVQYRESDYNFIARLLEEEGIWWHFAQSETAHVMRLADSDAAYAKIEGDAAELPFEPPSGQIAAAEHVSRFRLGQALRPTSVELTDFDFRKPRLSLHAFTVGDETGRDFCDYPGEYETQTEGAARAAVRLEELSTFRECGVGQSNSRRLAPARVFALRDHPIAELNREYLVTGVTYGGKQTARAALRPTFGGDTPALLNPAMAAALLAARQDGNPVVRQIADSVLQLAERLRPGEPLATRERPTWVYHGGQVTRDGSTAAAALGGNPLDATTTPNLLNDRMRDSRVSADEAAFVCEFECIPAETNYRPPRITHWPLMRGTQTAIVVGPRDEEVYTDEYGRVKVRFHWDLHSKEPDERASCWIRVSQGWAGGRYGMLFLPRVGHEVIVDFLEGDPDRPIIVGRVYNGDHMPPYPLPADKTRSTIKTLSSPSDQRYHEIRFEDRRGAEQLFMRAQRRMDTRVVGPHFHTVCGSLHERIGGKTREGPHGGYYRTASENVDLRVDDGGQLEFIKDHRTTTVGGHAIDEYLKNYAMYLEGMLEARAAQRIVMASETEVAFYVGDNFMRITPDGIQLYGKMIWLNDDNATPPAGISDREIEEAMPASPADDGQPGRGGRGGAARVRRKRLLKGLPGPVVISRPKTPPPVVKALTISAACNHDHNGPRRVIERQTLHVVPTAEHAHEDAIGLNSESTPPSPTPPHWTISNVGETDGKTSAFLASAPSTPSPRHIRWYWHAVAGTKRRYHVTCRDGHGNTEWLEVHAYPPVRRLCLRHQDFLNTLLGAIKRIEGKLDVLGIDFKLADKVDFKGEAGWKEDADGGVSFAYDCHVRVDPVAEIKYEKSVSLKKFIRRKLPRRLRFLSKISPGVEALVKVEGQMKCDASVKGTFRDGRWIYTPQGGVSGKIEVSVGLKGTSHLELVSLSGTLKGVFDISGEPFADGLGCGVKVAVGFSGIKGRVDAELKWLPDFGGQVTLWDADKSLYGPNRVYMVLDECSGGDGTDDQNPRPDPDGRDPRSKDSDPTRRPEPTDPPGPANTPAPANPPPPPGGFPKTWPPGLPRIGF